MYFFLLKTSICWGVIRKYIVHVNAAQGVYMILPSHLQEAGHQSAMFLLPQPQALANWGQLPYLSLYGQGLAGERGDTQKKVLGDG